MARKILVSGAPGKVGTELVRLLALGDREVRVLVHHVERSGEVSHPGVEIVEGDLTDRADMHRALRDVETFFLASSANDRQGAVETAAIEAAVSAGVERIVKLSAYGAAAGSPVPFFDWHGQAEETLLHSGVPWTLIRPYLYMQTLLQNIPNIQAQGAILNCGEGGVIPFVDARDVAAAAWIVLTTPGHDGTTYELTGPEALSWPEVAIAFGESLGRPVGYVAISASAMAAALSAAGMPGWLVDSLVGLMQFHQTDPGHVTNTLSALTGRQPRKLSEFLRDYASTGVGGD